MYYGEATRRPTRRSILLCGSVGVCSSMTVTLGTAIVILIARYTTTSGSSSSSSLISGGPWRAIGMRFGRILNTTDMLFMLRDCGLGPRPTTALLIETTPSSRISVDIPRLNGDECCCVVWVGSVWCSLIMLRTMRHPMYHNSV